MAMRNNKLIMLGMVVGSVAGGYVPLIWGGSAFSFSSIGCSLAGGVAGVYLAWKFLR